MEQKYNILVVDDNSDFLQSVKAVLKKHAIVTCLTLEQAELALNADTDLLLLDLVFDETTPEQLQGLNFIPYVHRRFPDLQILILTNHASIDIIVKALKYGATDFVDKKNLNWNEWKNRLENYCRNSIRIKELKERALNKDNYDESEIIGISSQIEYIRKRLKDLAQNSSDVSIFLCGETGTGKNLAVKYFKKYSLRRNKPFKEFSLLELSDSLIESELFGHVRGAFTGSVSNKKGLFEESDGGILFLDEIGDYDLRTQVKIMRFIENKSIIPVGSTTSKKLDLQLIMATNQDLSKLINEGKFREDLYQRINSVKIKLPPLRDRKEDINLLADYFFKYFKEKERTNLKSISDEVYQMLNKYNWPGNIRELQLVIWDGCTNARMHNDSILLIKHIKSEITNKNLISDKLVINEQNVEYRKASMELEEINNVLAKTNGRKIEAAGILNIKIDQLRYRVFKYYNLYPDLIKNFHSIIKYYKIIS